VALAQLDRQPAYDANGGAGGFRITTEYTVSEFHGIWRGAEL